MVLLKYAFKFLQFFVLLTLAYKIAMYFTDPHVFFFFIKPISRKQTILEKVV